MNGFSAIRSIKYLVVLLGLSLSACNLQDTLDGGSDSPKFTSEIGGSIGDGPVIGATVTVKNRNGEIIKTEQVSSSTFSFNLEVKNGENAYPLTVEAIGGTDLVSNAAPDVPLISVVFDPSENTLNLNPFSTLIVKTALAMPGGLTKSNVASARSAVLTNLSFGFDTSMIKNPVSSTVSASNAGVIIKASETLAEMIRRTRDVLLVLGENVTTGDVITAVASDIADGMFDGIGTEDADPRVSATAKVVSAQVLIEALSNHLKVGGIDATIALDNAILASFPDSPVGATSQVHITYEMVVQTRNAVSAAMAIAPSPELSDIEAILSTIVSGSLPSGVESVLPPELAKEFDLVIAMMPTASIAEIELVNNAKSFNYATCDLLLLPQLVQSKLDVAHLGLSVNGASVSQVVFSAPKDTTFEEYIAYSDAQIESRLIQWLVNQGSVAYSEHFLLLMDIEGIAHPKNLSDFLNEYGMDDFALLVDAYKRRVDITRKVLPMARIGVYGMPSPNGSALTIDDLDEQIAAIQLAADMGMLDSVDYVTTNIYPAFGPTDSAYGRLPARTQVAIESAKTLRRADGSVPGVMALFTHQIFNSPDFTNHSYETIPVDMARQQLEAAQTIDGLDIIAYWTAADSQELLSWLEEVIPQQQAITCSEYNRGE